MNTHPADPVTSTLDDGSVPVSARNRREHVVTPEPTVIRRVDGFWCQIVGGHAFPSPWEDTADAVRVVLWFKSQGITKVQVDLQ